jgi:hypothetical protein
MEHQNQLVLEDLSLVSSARHLLTDEVRGGGKEKDILSCHFRELETRRKKAVPTIETIKETDNNARRSSGWLFSSTQESSSESGETSSKEDVCVRSFSQKSTSSIMSSNSVSRLNSSYEGSQQNYDFGIVFESTSYFSKASKSMLENFPDLAEDTTSSTNRLKKGQISLFPCSTWTDAPESLVVKKSDQLTEAVTKSLSPSSPSSGMKDLTSTSTPAKRKQADLGTSSSEKQLDSGTLKSKRKFSRNNQSTVASSSISALDNSWDG